MDSPLSNSDKLCPADFLERQHERGKHIRREVFNIAVDTRDMIDEIGRDEGAIMQVYAEVAEAIGYRARTVRYWVEGIRGFTDNSISGWLAAGLSMEHFTQARKLYRDGRVDSPGEALDACINTGQDDGSPLTVDQMVSLFEEQETELQQFYRSLSGIRASLAALAEMELYRRISHKTRRRLELAAGALDKELEFEQIRAGWE